MHSEFPAELASGHMQPKLVLASRSPRRKELLTALCPLAEIEVLPPPQSAERDFEDCQDWPSIEARIQLIAREKLEGVAALLRTRGGAAHAIVIAADTAIVVREGGDHLRVLGQPPEDPTWPAVVRDWFTRYYLGQTHWALSGLCVQWPSGERRVGVVRTAVTFHPPPRDIDWYVSTEEPRGKAGGYAIQGAGSVFVSQVEGSLSNVVGLPLEPLREWLSGKSRADETDASRDACTTAGGD